MAGESNDGSCKIVLKNCKIDHQAKARDTGNSFESVCLTPASGASSSGILIWTEMPVSSKNTGAKQDACHRHALVNSLFIPAGIMSRTAVLSRKPLRCTAGSRL